MRYCRNCSHFKEDKDLRKGIEFYRCELTELIIEDPFFHNCEYYKKSNLTFLQSFKNRVYEKTKCRKNDYCGTIGQTKR